MTTSLIRILQGHAAAAVGARTADVALYGHLAGAPKDAVVRAARREVTDEQLAAMTDWVYACREQLAADAAVLDSVSAALPADPFTPVPAEAQAYRTAAEELALADGDSCAAVVWAGAAAEAKWVRLYGGRIMDLREALTDPVAVAAMRELGPEQCLRIATAVGRDWERIDERAATAA
ncbi:hypothetical protein [Mycobacteroides abscessus]|uniref:hypothetical protein n=1 Tax=Mycobacteroides abscessus TaxID=36809 RepID=UPI00092B908E|nr:hypothetical protein [Mycobacteroides abscessus]SIF24563.1 Uncharacterised protein [Mycobacteroides abscessus subsp. abscessus]SIF38211.1 Uncharacterised protein [Mycobacteroides abscessus subsp. abscessus]SIF84485.1 Uncharacterised protein [Mycobacteroides abscessus subsp. abscessus]